MFYELWREKKRKKLKTFALTDFCSKAWLT